MHDEAYPHEEDPHANAGAPTDGDESHETSDAPGRRPIPEFFSRLAGNSKDTGRWHKLTGGGDHHEDDQSDVRDANEDR